MTRHFTAFLRRLSGPVVLPCMLASLSPACAPVATSDTYDAKGARPQRTVSLTTNRVASHLSDAVVHLPPGAIAITIDDGPSSLAKDFLAASEAFGRLPLTFFPAAHHFFEEGQAICDSVRAQIDQGGSVTWTRSDGVAVPADQIDIASLRIKPGLEDIAGVLSKSYVEIGHHSFCHFVGTETNRNRAFANLPTEVRHLELVGAARALRRFKDLALTRSDRTVEFGDPLPVNLAPVLRTAGNSWWGPHRDRPQWVEHWNSQLANAGFAYVGPVGWTVPAKGGADIFCDRSQGVAACVDQYIEGYRADLRAGRGSVSLHHELGGHQHAGWMFEVFYRFLTRLTEQSRAAGKDACPRVIPLSCGVMGTCKASDYPCLHEQAINPPSWEEFSARRQMVN